MQPTKSLGVLKGLLDSFHQPLPLSTRESQRIYQKLTTSFRQQLAREHGWSPDEQLHPNQSQHRDPDQRNSPVSNALSISPQADRNQPVGHRHLRSILSNPLFSYDASSRSHVATAEKDPMDVFDEAVSKGLMTPLRAAGCLKAKHRQILQSSAADIQSAMASSRSGRRVVDWLRASGAERNLDFILNNEYQQLMPQLVPFLLAEDLEEIIWSWLNRLLEEEQHLKSNLAASRRPLPKATNILSILVYHKHHGAESLDGAYACLRRAEEDLPWPKAEITPEFIMAPWRHLEWESTVLAWKHIGKPSRSLFESFYAIGERQLALLESAKKLTARLAMEMAHLALYHPTNPSPSQAMELLQDTDKWESWIISRDKVSHGRPGLPLAITIKMRALGLDTVRIFAQRGETEKAESALRLIMNSRLNKDFIIPAADDLSDDPLSDLPMPSGNG